MKALDHLIVFKGPCGVIFYLGIQRLAANDDIPPTEQSVVGPLVAYDAINCFKTGLMAATEMNSC